MGRPRRAVMLATLVLAAAVGVGCSDDAGDPGDSGDDGATTSTEARDRPPPGGYRATAEVDLFGETVELTATVLTPAVNRIEVITPALSHDVLRVAGQAWERTASGEDIEGQRWRPGSADELSAVGRLQDLATIAEIGEFEGFGAFYAADALAELLLVDPGEFVDLRAIDEAESTHRPDVPFAVSNALAPLGVEPPDLELTIVLESKRPTEATLTLGDGFFDVTIEARWFDYGRVLADEVRVPDAADIEPTPEVDEELLRDWTGAPLVAPVTLPTGFELQEAHVLPSPVGGSVCDQVELVYGPRLAEGVIGDSLTIFLTDKACLTFDPTPFDESFGGHPARYDGRDLIIGGTGVQLYPSGDAVEAELEVVVASVAAIDANALIDAVR